MNEFKGVVGQVPSLAPTFMQMDFEGLFTASMVGVIFVFFIVDLFDSTGTLVGVSHRAGLLQDGKLPRLKKALFADSTAIVAGAVIANAAIVKAPLSAFRITGPQLHRVIGIVLSVAIFVAAIVVDVDAGTRAVLVIGALAEGFVSVRFGHGI